MFVKVWTISHLGKNPKNGGSPPNDKKFNMMESLTNLFWFKEFIICVKNNEAVYLKIITILKVMIE